jgi:hypothetical protein
MTAVAVSAAPQQSPLPPTATAAEVATYEAFRAWITRQPPAIQNEDDAAVFARHAVELRAQGKGAQEIDATIASLKGMGDRAEVERWNRILTAAEPRFNTAPNAFLVAVTSGVKPGRSLDVGMGQGRNTIYLAQQGWESVGFDPADRAVAAAQAQAAKLGVKIATSVARADDYDWGENRWDLIVLSYVGAREERTEDPPVDRRRWWSSRRQGAWAKRTCAGARHSAICCESNEHDVHRADARSVHSPTRSGQDRPGWRVHLPAGVFASGRTSPRLIGSLAIYSGSRATRAQIGFDPCTRGSDRDR